MNEQARAAREEKQDPARSGRIPFWRSIQMKYAITYLLLVAAILIVMNSYPLIMAQNMVFTSKENTLKRQALVIVSALAVSEGGSVCFHTERKFICY